MHKNHFRVIAILLTLSILMITGCNKTENEPVASVEPVIEESTTEEVVEESTIEESTVEPAEEIRVQMENSEKEE